MKAYLLVSEKKPGTDAPHEVLGPWNSERSAMLAGIAHRRKNLVLGGYRVRDFSIHALEAIESSSGLVIGGVLQAAEFLKPDVQEDQAVLLKGIPAGIFVHRTLPALEERLQAA